MKQFHYEFLTSEFLSTFFYLCKVGYNPCFTNRYARGCVIQTAPWIRRTRICSPEPDVIDDVQEPADSVILYQNFGNPKRWLRLHYIMVSEGYIGLERVLYTLTQGSTTQPLV